MSAFYFGSSETPLYGFYHGPGSRPVQRSGIVICNPMGREYLRSHRSLKRLAERLSDAGYHVLRFDYSGTGDSAGEGMEIELGRWMDDTAVAIEELKAMSGVRRVSVVGVRLGGVVAAEAASRRDDMEDMVLWDPVVDGEGYVRRHLDQDSSGETNGPAGTGSLEGGDRLGVGGFPLPASFRQEVCRTDLSRIEAPPVRRVLLVSSEERPEFDALEERLRTLEAHVIREHRPGAEGWDNPGRMGSIVLVPAVVGTITHFFENTG